jgi:hypothetical protein
MENVLISSFLTMCKAYHWEEVQEGGPKEGSLG